MNKKKLEWETFDIEKYIGSSEESKFDGEEGHSIIDYIVSRYSERSSPLSILHTNFNLGTKILINISKIEGIEILLPVSRYKAMIAFGKLFDEEEVKIKVKAVVNKLLYPTEIWKNIDEDSKEGV